ncbi:MAG: zinc-ribbon domain-containing protein [Desulfomonilia bacterium]
MIVVQCPVCRSRFRIEKDALPDRVVKMRCSVCSNVFSYNPAVELLVEQDFATAIGARDGNLEDSFFTESPAPEPTGGITETMKERGPLDTDPSEDLAQPESVIKEIDSILGAGEEMASVEDTGRKARQGKGKGLRLFLTVVLIILIFLGTGLWIMKDRIPFFKNTSQALGETVLERGPFFSIPEESITYELLSNNSEGSVLVVKGIVKKLTTKPLKSILVQARVYDRNGKLIESRTAFAGIIPESAEFVHQKGSDIQSLLTAEPRSLGTFTASEDIPFAVAFFGKAALEGSSFQVEVKEFHWK